jgi:hypothetical protein
MPITRLRRRNNRRAISDIRSRSRRSVGGSQNLRQEIFDIGCTTGFSSTVSFYRPLCGFHRPPAESLAVNPGIRRHNRFVVHALENCHRDPAFVGSEHKRNAGYIEARQDFLRCWPPVKRFRENRAFLRLVGSCRRHFGSFAGNPPKSRNSSARTGCFRSSAEFLESPLNFSKVR